MIKKTKITVSKEQIILAIEQAKKNIFIDNLRNRSINVAFDSKIRGYVGEISVKKWFEDQGIFFEEKSQKASHNLMDIDFIFQGNHSKIEIELKTSLIPDEDITIENAIHKRDIKLIRRNNEPIEALKSDVHLQLFFKQRRAAKDMWLKKQDEIKPQDNVEMIYQALGCYRYLDDTYLIAWIDKKKLIDQIHKKTEKTKMWSYGKRQFWTCNIENEAKPIKDLILFLKSQ